MLTYPVDKEVQINNKTYIIGYPAVRIRDFLRKAIQTVSAWNIYYLTERMRISVAEAESVLSKLCVNGYIHSPHSAEGIKYWEVTSKGRTLALASASLPISRPTADRIIKEFFKRVEEVNANNSYVYKVNRVAVFGSYLSDKEKLGDVDLAVFLEPKGKDQFHQNRFLEKRIQELVNQGVRFRDPLKSIFLPYTEVQKYLRSQTKYLSLHFDDKIIETAKSKVIMDKGIRV